MSSGNEKVEMFKEELKSTNLPVLVDFWAAWCGPCKALMPVLEKIEKKFNGRLIIKKVNIEDDTDLAAEYRVQSIPTLKIFNKEEVLSTRVGGGTEEAIEEWIEKSITK